MMKKVVLLMIVVLTTIVLGSCSENAENEHLPEYCQTYSGFMEIASPDMYELLEGINSRNYLTKISEIELEFEMDDPNREIDLDGIQCFQNLTSLTLIGESFKDISEISALSNIQRIHLEDTSVVDISSFKNLSKVNELVIRDTKTLQSVDGVEEMTKLVSLELTYNGIVNIDGLNQLTNLRELNLSNNEIRFFPTISNLDQLVELNISHNEIEYLAEDLSGLSNLEILDASNNNIFDISSLDDLESLRILDLSFNDLGREGGSPDFSSLLNATDLTELYLNDNGLESIADLAGKNLPLEVLYLQNNELTDLSPIADYTSVLDLKLYNNQISNIANLDGMTNLTEIDLSDNTIVDFSNLRSIPNLSYVDLSDNQISFIPDLSESWDNLVSLDLSNNVITDTSGVEGHESLETLILTSNGLEELSGISHLPMLSELVLDLEIDEETGLPFIDPETELPYVDENPNSIRVIRNSFNDVPSMELSDEGYLSLGFDLTPNGEIYGSFIDLNDITGVDFTDFGIDVIDEFSFTSTEIGGFLLSGNNLTDISFLQGNPGLLFVDISDNQVTDFSILNGNNTNDFDNLQQFYARNMGSVMVLDEAFVSLPNLTNIDMDASDVSSIHGSFVDLPELVEFHIGGDSLVSITDSFVDIFASYSTTNIVAFDGGLLETITGSFKNGLYEQIAIQNQEPLNDITLIDDSFVNLDVSNVSSIGLVNSDFKTISNSFISVDVDNLYLFNNGTETISGSFTGSSVLGELNVQNNELSDLDLSGFVTVSELDLSHNALTTVFFLDGLSDVTSIDLTDQSNSDNTVLTLETLDGINNMPLLEILILDELGITSIDGLKNIGLTSFVFTDDDNSGVPITSISPTSFLGTNLTTLNLQGHVFSDIAFLDNVSNLDSLTIGVNMIDLSDFSGLALEASLETLSLESLLSVPSFAPLSGYDGLETFVFSSEATTSIQDLDGMDSLSLVTFSDRDGITSISNSFNDMASFEPSSSYVVDFDGLSSITSSFDRIGEVTNALIEINGDMVITDSFHTVQFLSINNGTEESPLFDALSFTNIEQLTMIDPNYSDYAFISNYALLDDLVIANPQQNLVNVNHPSLSQVTVSAIANTIDSASFDLDTEAEIVVTSASAGNLVINADSRYFDLDMSSRDVAINNGFNSDTQDSVISGLVGTLSFTNNTVSDLSLTSLTVQGSLLVNGSLIDNIDGATAAADSLNLTSSQASLTIDIATDDITINDTGISTLSIDSQTASVVIGTLETDLIMDLNVDSFTSISSSVETLTMSGGSVDTMVIQSAALYDFDAGSSTINDLNIVTDVTTVNVGGFGIGLLDISDDSITSLSLNTSNADVSLTSDNTLGLNINAVSDSLSIDAANVPSMVFDDTSDINDLDLGTILSVDSITLGSAAINSLSLVTPDTSIAFSGTAINDFNISADNANSVTMNVPNSDVVFGTLSATLAMDVNAGTFTVSNATALTSLSMTDTSSLSVLGFNNSNEVNDLNMGLASIGETTIVTFSSSFDYDGINTSDLSVQGPNVASLTIDIGTGSFTYDSARLGITSASIIASNAFMDINNSTFTLSNDSDISDLNISSSLDGLTNMILGSAEITNINLNGANTNFSMIATNVLSINSSAQIENFDLDLPSSTNVNLNLPFNGDATIDVNTDELTVYNGSSVVLNSDTVTTLTASGSNDFTYNSVNPSFGLNIDADVTTLVLNAAGLHTLSIDPESSFNSLALTDVTITSIDLNNFGTQLLSVIGDQVSMDIAGSDLGIINLNMPNLSSLNTSDTNSAVINVTSDTLSPVFSGVGSSMVYTNPTMTSLDVDSALYTELEITGESLEGLSVSLMGQVTIYSDVASFDLELGMTEAEFYTVSDVNPATTLNLTSALGNINLNTDVETLVLSTPNATVSGDMNRLTSISGSALSFEPETLGAGVLSFDLDANEINFDDNGITDVILNGNYNMLLVAVRGNSLDNVSTNNVNIGTLYVQNDVAGITSIDTVASTVQVDNVSNQGSGDLTLRNADTSVLINIPSVDIESTVLGSLSVNYNGTAGGDYSFTTVSDLEFVSDSNNTLSISGDIPTISIAGVALQSLTLNGTVDDISIIGTGISDMDTLGLTVNNSFTANILINDLSFLSDSVINNVSTISMTNLITLNLDTIIETLSGTGINLQTNGSISDADVIEYFTGVRYLELAEQEEIDGLTYDEVRADMVADALNLFRQNEYFDYMTDVALEAQIDAQLYDSVQSYFNGYATSLGLTEQEMIDDTENYGQAYVDAVKDSITATLTDDTMVILESEITTEIINILTLEASVLAQDDASNKGFTIIG